MASSLRNEDKDADANDHPSDDDGDQEKHGLTSNSWFREPGSHGYEASLGVKVALFMTALAIVAIIALTATIVLKNGTPTTQAGLNNFNTFEHNYNRMPTRHKHGRARPPSVSL